MESSINLNLLKTGKHDKSLSAIIKETSLLREKSDYDDLYRKWEVSHE